VNGNAATGAVATINSTVWLLAGSLSWWPGGRNDRLDRPRLAWLVIDGELGTVPPTTSRERGKVSPLQRLDTGHLMIGVLICYVALYVVNLAWAFFALDPAVTGDYLHASLGYHDLFVLAWFVASAATIGGGLGSGLQSDDAIRAAAYSKREEDRRDRLARRPEPEAVRTVTTATSRRSAGKVLVPLVVRRQARGEMPVNIVASKSRPRHHR
jgi:hypothetical protein